MPTESQKLASRKWDANNTKVLGCKVRKEIAEQFEQYCSDLGKRPNAVLKEFILSCIGASDDLPSQER